MPAYFETGTFTGQSAWHDQGTVIAADDPARFSVNDSIDRAELTWGVDLAKVYAFAGGEAYPVPGQYATMRVYPDGRREALGGIVGSRYEPLQNRQAFEWFQPWLDTREVHIESAGSLLGGQMVWVLARILREDMDIGGGDKVLKYLLLSTGHDGRRSTRVGFTPIRVVCWNTLSAAFSNKASQLLRVRHTKGQIDSLNQIRETIDLIDQNFNATAEQYRGLKRCPISRADLKRYVRLVVGLEEDDKPSPRMGKRMDDMIRLALFGKGQSASELTVWSGYSGVSEYLTHRAGSDSEKRTMSNLEGTYADMNKRAFDLALQLAS